MNITIYNKSYNVTGTISDFEGFEYVDKINDVGEFAFVCVNNSYNRTRLRSNQKDPVIIGINGLYGIVTGYSIDVSTNTIKVQGATMNIVLDWHIAEYTSLNGPDSHNVAQLWEETSRICHLDVGTYDPAASTTSYLQRAKNRTLLSDNQSCARYWRHRFWVEFHPDIRETRINFKRLGSATNFIANDTNTSSVTYSQSTAKWYDYFDVNFTSGTVWGDPLTAGGVVSKAGLSNNFVSTTHYETFSKYKTFAPDVDIAPSKAARVPATGEPVIQYPFDYFSVANDSARVKKVISDKFEMIKGNRDESYSAVILGASYSLGNVISIYDTRVTDTVHSGIAGYVGDFIVSEIHYIISGDEVNTIINFSNELPGNTDVQVGDGSVKYYNESLIGLSDIYGIEKAGKYTKSEYTNKQLKNKDRKEMKRDAKAVSKAMSKEYQTEFKF